MASFSNTHSSRDYDYYNRWTFQFPLASLLLIFAASVITIVLAVLFRRALGKNLTEPYDKLNKRQICLKLFLGGLRDTMLRTINFLLFEFEKIEQTDEKAKKKHKYEYRLHGVPVHLFVLQYLFIVLLSILAVSVLSFWNVFFADSALDVCSELLDCFPVYRDNSTPIEIEPITNCSEHIVDEDSTIICFEVVYRYSEGLGEAGGFLFSMQVIINIVIYVVVSIFRTVLKITKIASNREVARVRTMSDIGRKWPCGVPRFAKALTMSLTLAMYLIILILLPVWVLHQREDFLSTIETSQRRMQLALYAYTVFELFLVPLIVGSGVYARRTYNRIKVKLTDRETEMVEAQNATHIQNHAAVVVVETSGEIEKEYQQFNETQATE